MIERKSFGRMALTAALLAAAPVAAEPVSGVERMVCNLLQVTICEPYQDCRWEPPADSNLPDFIVVDVAAKTLSSTAANERPRVTSIGRVERDQGFVFLQGIENARAYSIVIAEETGELSASLSTPGANLSVHGSCTPLPIAAPGGGS